MCADNEVMWGGRSRTGVWWTGVGGMEAESGYSFQCLSEQWQGRAAPPMKC